MAIMETNPDLLGYEHKNTLSYQGLMAASNDSYDSDSSHSSGPESGAYDSGDWKWDSETQNWYWISFNGFDPQQSSSEESTDSESSAADSEENESSEEDEASDDNWYDSDSETEFTDTKLHDDDTGVTQGYNHSTTRDAALIIFDWDDTIMPTSYLQTKLGSNTMNAELNANLEQELSILETRVLETLRLAQAIAKVKVITNAASGWVEMSAGKFMPYLLNFLQQNDIEIISARSMHEDQFESQWEYKKEAFSQEARSMISGGHNDLEAYRFVSIGDSEQERYATKALTNVIPQSCLRIVKLNSNYTSSSIGKQLGRLQGMLRDIVSQNEHLDFEFEY